MARIALVQTIVEARSTVTLQPYLVSMSCPHLQHYHLPFQQAFCHILLHQVVTPSHHPLCYEQVMGIMVAHYSQIPRNGLKYQKTGNPVSHQ